MDERKDVRFVRFMSGKGPLNNEWMAIKGGSGNGHYGGNAETYMNVGEAMGKAMVDLLKE